jgi:hypothetical protein
VIKPKIEIICFIAQWLIVFSPSYGTPIFTFVL